MDHSRNDLLAQGNIHIEGASDDFFRVFGIRTLLHQCGMRKHHGYSLGMILGVVFNLAFLGWPSNISALPKKFRSGIMTG